MCDDLFKTRVVTDGRTDVQTDRGTDKVIAVTLCLHFAARVNNYYIAVYKHIQDEYERKLLIQCDEGTGDENEILYLLSRPEVNPDVYDEVATIIK